MKRQVFVENEVDSHVYYWDPGRRDYGWPTPALEQLYRVFGLIHEACNQGGDRFKKA